MKKEGIVEMTTGSLDLWVVLVEEDGKRNWECWARGCPFKGVMMIHV